MFEAVLLIYVKSDLYNWHDMSSYVFLKKPVLFLRNILQSHTLFMFSPTQFASIISNNLIFSPNPIISLILAESGDVWFPLFTLIRNGRWKTSSGYPISKSVFIICFIYLWIGNHYSEVQKLPTLHSTSNRKVAWYKVFITVKQCSMECCSNSQEASNLSLFLTGDSQVQSRTVG